MQTEDLNREDIIIDIRHDNWLENSKSIRRTSNTTNNLKTISTTYQRNQGKPTFRGILDKKKLYRPTSLQYLDSPSKSNISPIGVPQPASTHSCKLNSLSACAPRIGARSKLGASPATAANCLSHNQRTMPSVASTPLKSGDGRSASSLRCSLLSLLYASVNPLRMKRISPFWKSRLWSFATFWRFSSVIASDVRAEMVREFVEAHSA
jgi:hypothetical protein